MHVFNNNQQEVMRITREFKCCTGCCWYLELCLLEYGYRYSFLETFLILRCAGCSEHCSLEVKVESPPGNVIGYCKQK